MLFCYFVYFYLFIYLWLFIDILFILVIFAFLFFLFFSFLVVFGCQGNPPESLRRWGPLDFQPRPALRPRSPSAGRMSIGRTLWLASACVTLLTPLLRSFVFPSHFALVLSYTRLVSPSFTSRIWFHFSLPSLRFSLLETLLLFRPELLAFFLLDL